MNKADLKEFENKIKDLGSAIGEVIAGLDVPEEIKEILAQKAIDLIEQPEEFREYALSLLTAYVEDQMIEQDPEYQAELARIDKETEEEIEKILNN